MPNLTIGWLHLAALLGAVQGLVLAGALATKHRNRTANRLLAAAMLSFSLFLATDVYHAAGLEQRFPHFFGAGYPQPFVFGPLIYLYALAAADRSRRLRRWDALHFVPFVGFILVGLPVYMMSGAGKIAFYQALLAGHRPPFIMVADPLKLVSGVAYAIATIVFLTRHRERVKDSYSSTERVNLRWLLWLGAAAGFIWLLAVAFQLLDTAGLGRFAGADTTIALAVAALVYAIGYRGLRQPEIFRYETAEYPVPVAAQSAVAAPSLVVHSGRETVSSGVGEPPSGPRLLLDHESTGEPQGARYERSGLSDRQAERLKEAVVAVMETERPWKNSELTLAELAARLNTTPHKLSEVLNSQLGVTFYDFVNGYRVREVQRRIAAGEAQRVRMLTLALDAGFASKSTFNLVFKKHTSQTPSDYRQAAGDR